MPVYSITVQPKSTDCTKFLTGSLPMEAMRLSFGGDALNEAAALARMGAHVELISKAGLDEAVDIVSFAGMFVSPLLDISAMERIFQRIKKKPGRVLAVDMTKAKRGEQLEDCGRFACAAASCTAEHMGAAEGIYSIDEPMHRYQELHLKA